MHEPHLNRLGAKSTASIAAPLWISVRWGILGVFFAGRSLHLTSLRRVRLQSVTHTLLGHDADKLCCPRVDVLRRMPYRS